MFTWSVIMYATVIIFTSFVTHNCILGCKRRITNYIDVIMNINLLNSCVNRFAGRKLGKQEYRMSGTDHENYVMWNVIDKG